MKVAIMTDSNSGITQAEGKKLGIFVLPMPFTIDQKEYLEDINLTQDEFYNKLMNNAEVFTSQPAVGEVTHFFNTILEEYDQIVHIPMSSGLSGSCQTARMLAEDYDGKVEVVNNQRISVTQRQSVLDAKKMAKEGKTAKEIRQYLETTKFDSSIYIMLDTLKYLKKGGRITPAAAALGTLLRLKPVLQIQGEKLDAFAKARTIKQAKNIMITAIGHDMEQRFGDKSGAKIHLCIAHTDNEEAALELKEELKAVFPDTGEIHIDPLSLSVSCHIGPGALAIACAKVIEL